MPKRPTDSPQRNSAASEKPAVPLPYPDSDLPPVLQRTIKRKIEEGGEGLTEAAYLDALRRAARTEQPD